MKYFIIAGESSGDLHGSNLIKALKTKDNSAQFFGCGGYRMHNAGCKLVLHIDDMDFMGFVEVIKHLSLIRKNFEKVELAFSETQPDLLILIDYPGFNLRLLKRLDLSNTKVVYYIPPQLWAWKKGRIKVLEKYCDELLLILPFEKNFYDNFSVKSHFVGHPLLDAIEVKSKTERELIALLPGSRKQEIQKMLPVYLEVAKNFKDKKFAIAGLGRFGIEYYNSFNLPDNVSIHLDGTYELLSNSSFAFVTSGTATLETALLGVPQVVSYKLNFISYIIAKVFAKVEYISLVNLIMKDRIVEEYIQSDCNANNLSEFLNLFLTDNSIEKLIKNSYEKLQLKLGKKGASTRAAERIYALGSSM